jgi:hypothetical protein
MADKLSSRQQAQVTVLESLPAKFSQMHRLIEEMASLRADISVVRRLCRVLDEGKGATSGVGLSSLTQTMGSMGMLARRTGGEQMKIRGLREGLASLKINFDGALRAAKTPVAPGVEDPTTGA